MTTGSSLSYDLLNLDFVAFKCYQTTSHGSQGKRLLLHLEIYMAYLPEMASVAVVASMVEAVASMVEDG